MYYKIDRDTFIFYFIVFIGLVTVLFSFPFLRYPYDMYEHLIRIDNYYYQEWDIPSGRKIWHFFWAKLFMIFSLDSMQFFLRAKLIHVTQTGVALFSVYFFSHVVIRNLFKPIAAIEVRYLALWSVIVWITIFATFSIHHHQVWLLWYSVNYQITLAFFWYITALTLVLVLEPNSQRKKVFLLLQIVLFSFIIIRIHAMEYMYYFMHLVLIIILFFRKYVVNIKQLLAFLVFLVFTTLLVANFLNEKPRIFEYISLEKLPELYTNIMQSGQTIMVLKLDRSLHAINELMVISLVVGFVMFITLIWFYFKQKQYTLNLKLFTYIFLSACFVFIPLFEFSAGFFGLTTKLTVINRLYYSASLFVLLPIVVYFFTKIVHVKFRYVHSILLFLLVSTTIFSKHSTTLNHNYYKNLRSIGQSFHKEKMSFHLSQEEIELIGQKVKAYEQQNSTAKPLMYYARPDIAFVLKYMFHKHVYWETRRFQEDYGALYMQKRSVFKQYRPAYIHVKGIPKLERTNRGHVIAQKAYQYAKKFKHTFQELQAKIEQREKKSKKKDIMFYANPDITWIIKNIYHKKVYEQQRSAKNVRKAYIMHKDANKFKHIKFDTPPNVSGYKPFL